MHPSNQPPFSSKRTSESSQVVVFEPYVLHIMQNVTRDLQFLRQQGCISSIVLEEILEKLPKPVVHAAPHTPPALSPTSSPIPRSESPAESHHSKKNSTIFSPQRPLSSASSQISQEQPLYPFKLEENGNRQQSQQIPAPQRRPTSPPRPTETPPPLHDTPPPQPQLQQNQNVVNAEQSQFEHQSLISRPEMPSRDSVYQHVHHHPTSPPNSSSSSISNTGAIMATRPLPHPPNSSSSSPPRPQAPPVFNNKSEEAEYERSMGQQQKRESMLPAYSLSIVEAMWDFKGDDAGDLGFRKGDIVEVVEYVNMDWWRGRIQGTSKIGIFPKIYTRILPTQVPLNNNNTIPDQPVANNNSAYYSPQRLPSNNIPQQIRPAFQQPHSSSHGISQQQQLQQQQQQQLRQQHQQQSPHTYSHHSQPAHGNHLNSRSSTNSLNGQQSYYH